MTERLAKNHEEEPIDIGLLKEEVIDLLVNNQADLRDAIGIPKESQAVQLILDSDQGRVNIMSGKGPKGHYLQGIHVSVNSFDKESKIRKTRSWNIGEESGQVIYSDYLDYEGDLPEVLSLHEAKNMSDEEFADTMSKNAMDTMSRAHKKIKSQEFEKELGINNQPATQEELKDLKSLIEGDLSPVERRW